jgi:Tol biopolymer transport system component
VFGLASRKVVDLGGYDTGGAMGAPDFTPDGKRLIYSRYWEYDWNDEPRLQPYSVDLTQVPIPRPTEFGKQGQIFGAASPDGTKTLLVERGADGLHLVYADANGENQVAGQLGEQPSWQSR